MNSTLTAEEVTAVSRKLLAYCRTSDWAGYDPYDALNSKLFSAMPVLNSTIPRIVLTQALKRSPINIRRFALVPKTQNPKAIALFLAAVLRLDDSDPPAGEDLSGVMIERLIALRSPGTPDWCWGYSFPWQSRRFVVPLGAPNVVCTSFVANALLDAYERRGEARCLTMAASAARYIVDNLYWTRGSDAGFSYPVPESRVLVYNANFLGAALLCRVHKHTGNRQLLRTALTVARCSASKQRDDGSWDYGDDPSHRWIDNFHTGYNLCALHALGPLAGTSEFVSRVRRGFAFYRDHFFRPDGAPRYFHNRTYPIDIHCVAQSLITLTALKDLDPNNVPLAQAVFRWAMAHMWDDRGFFYYRVLRLATIRTSYMRWSQAWMLFALSVLRDDCLARAGHGRPALEQASA